MRVDRDIDRERVAKAEALRAQVDGISIKVGQQRAYPEGDVGAHLVGYLGRPRPEEVAGGDPLRFQETSMVGRFGLEEVYETTLAGRNGFERFVVNARGARAVDQRALGAVDDVIREPAVPGNDLVLTIDSDVQAILLQALSRYESGAVVVVDPRDGSVIGMVSKPGFDPNLWSGRLSADVKRATDENPYNPMIDKTVHSFFPGSIYKIVTALAGLEENVIQADQKIDSPGSYEFGNHIFHCHKLSGHGLVDLSGAIAASADVYFYKLGEKLGIDTLATYATRFGFGRRSGLGINGESPGIVPTKAWHDEHTPGGYQFGLALSTAIGQGDVRATPLQLAMAYAALANGGTLYAPRIIDRIQSPDGTVVQRVAPKVIGTLGARPEHIQQIIAGLERAVEDKDIGTATQAAVPYGRVAGKTGTAQVREIERARYSDKTKDFRDRDHAWFASFAPAESPRLAVVVFLEHGGTGGKEAAPIARQIYEAYHQRVEPIFNTAASNDPPGGGRERVLP